MVALEGTIEYVQHPRAYKNPMEWSVLQIKTKQGRTKAVGEIQPVRRGEVFRFLGEFVNTKYGREFHFKQASRSDQGESGAGSYLGTLFGVKTAQRIIAQWGSAEEALTVFKTDADLLLSTKGVGKKTLLKAQAKHAKLQVAETLFSTLRRYGMTLHLALKVYKHYGVDALVQLQKNPYRVLYEMEGIGFSLCDRWAPYFGVKEDAPIRVEAGILATLESALRQGHTFLPTRDLQRQASRLLGAQVSSQKITQQLIRFIQTQRVVEEKGARIYLPAYHEYEREVATNALRLLGKRKVDPALVQQYISEFEQHHQIVLADRQRTAILRAIQENFSIITGPPGSGKTTILQAILEVSEKIHQHPLQWGLAAPTGKAARRMSESTGVPAKTIHKLLGYRVQEGKWTFDYTAHHPLPYHVVVIDEVSMLDLYLAHHLFQAISSGTQVIFVGDQDQLPSVGAGQVLADLLASGRIPTTTLDEIYRQKQGSHILESALAVSRGSMPSLATSGDFTFIEQEDISSLLEEMFDRFYAAVRANGLDEVVILSPMRKDSLGIYALNRTIQQELNPPQAGKREVKFGATIFREGDRVIQVRPNEEEGLVNGQMGYVDAYIPEDPFLGEEEHLIVDYDGEKVAYPRDRFDEIELAYALTIHKSQGSEWKSVFIPIHPDHQFMLSRRLLYTAMTRAKEHLTLFGESTALAYAVHDHQEQPRYSVLAERIRGILA